MQIKVRREITGSVTGGYRRGHQSPRCGSAMAAARTAVTVNRNVDPDGDGGWGLGVGGRRRTERLQEGCSSESESSLVADVTKRRSLVPRKIYSAHEYSTLITRSLIPLIQATALASWGPFSAGGPGAPTATEWRAATLPLGSEGQCQCQPGRSASVLSPANTQHSRHHKDEGAHSPAHKHPH